MNNKLRIHNITISDDGRRIDYEYSIGIKIKKFFKEDVPFYVKYDVDISNIPKSILVIPLLSNIVTIAWYGCFDIEVDELDEDFYNSIQKVKDVFKKRDSSYTLKSNLIVNKLFKNKIKGDKSALLFSGGVDAFASYIRQIDKIPNLVTIHGPDISIEDKEQWQDLTTFIENQDLLKKNSKNYIESNVRDFYTYEVNLLIDGLGWWGKVQHGLSLLGVVSPISLVNGFSNLTISSTYSDQMDVVWGSKPEIDEKLSWAGIKIHHDAYELRRQDKVDLIAEFSEQTNTHFKLRVCYSELRSEFNCSKCEKCYRTILGLVLAGENPNKYGFKVDEKFYDKMFRLLKAGSANKGMQYFWWELMEKAKTTESAFIFKEKAFENKQLNRIRAGEIHNMLENKINNPKRFTEKVKFILRNRFSNIYNLYKKIRYS